MMKDARTMRRNLKPGTRLLLIQEIYDWILNATNTFEGEDRIGASFAYLTGAIAKGHICVWIEQEPLVRLLRQRFPKDHLVWYFIKIGR
jgi:hypothetical protein